MAQHPQLQPGKLPTDRFAQKPRIRPSLLSAQRGGPGSLLMDLKACARLNRRPLTGYWIRALNLKYWNRRLSSNHTTTTQSRFSAASPSDPLYRLVYFGADHQVALHEIRALLGNPASPVADPRKSYVVMSFNAILHSIVDLTDPMEQTKLQTNYAELTGNWTNDPGRSPTQELGRALFRVPDLEGFLYPSSLINNQCLAIFPDKLQPRSKISFRNEMDAKPISEVLD